MTNRKKAIIGVDIGGYKIDVVLWNGRVAKSKNIRTPKNRKDFIMGLMG